MRTKSTVFSDRVGKIMSILFLVSVLMFVVCCLFSVNKVLNIVSVVFVALTVLYRYIEALLDWRQLKEDRRKLTDQSIRMQKSKYSNGWPGSGPKQKAKPLHP